MDYVLLLTRQGCAEQRFALSESQTTIGCDAGSDISIEGEAQLLERHILVAVDKQQCWISTRSGFPLIDSSGNHVEAQFVPWGTPLTLGDCVFRIQCSKKSKKLRFLRNRKAPTSDKESDCSKGPKPSILMLLLITLAYAGYTSSKPGPYAEATPSNAPAVLFDRAEACQSESSPLYRARIASQEAQAKLESSVFANEDAVQAARLFAEVADCYHLAKRQDKSDEATLQAQQLKRQLQEEFKLLRLRLKRALQKNDTPRAQSHIRELLQFLAHRDSSKFARHLHRLELRLSREQNRHEHH